MHNDPECYLPKETEVHVMAPESAAPCDVDFLLVPHNNLAELRLPSDAVPGTPCITACITEIVAHQGSVPCIRSSGFRRLNFRARSGGAPSRLD